MCSWNLTESKGTKWDFPSKIKSLELNITPQKSNGSQKEQEIINCKFGWLMLSGRVQSFEDGLKIPCHSWICEKPLGQMLVLPIWVTKAGAPLGWSWHSYVESSTLSSTATFAGGRSVIQSYKQMTFEGTVVCKSPSYKPWVIRCSSSSLHEQDVKHSASRLLKWISLICGGAQHLSCCSSQCKLWMLWSNYFWIKRTIYSLLTFSLKINERESLFNQNKIQKRKSITI